jgi:hypothetical protein
VPLNNRMTIPVRFEAHRWIFSQVDTLGYLVSSTVIPTCFPPDIQSPGFSLGEIFWMLLTRATSVSLRFCLPRLMIFDMYLDKSSFPLHQLRISHKSKLFLRPSSLSYFLDLGRPALCLFSTDTSIGSRHFWFLVSFRRH